MNNRIKKIIILIIKIIIIGLLIWLISNQYDEVDYENLPLNTYYNNVSGAKEKYRLTNVKKFIKNIEEIKYEEAYNLLSDKCKEEKFYNNIEAFKEFIKTYFIDYNKPEKIIYYEKVEENGSSKNIRVTFAIKDANDYYDAPTDEQGIKYYQINTLDILIEEESLFNYKYYIQLNNNY